MYHLLNKIRDFSEWGQCLVLELLLRYTPESTDEVFELMVRICPSVGLLPSCLLRVCVCVCMYVYRICLRSGCTTRMPA